MEKFASLSAAKQKAALIVATKELQELCGFSPALKTTGTVKVLTEKAVEAAGKLVPEDELTEGTLSLLRELGGLSKKFLAAHPEEEEVVSKKGKKEKKEKKGKKEEAPAEEEEEEEEEAAVEKKKGKKDKKGKKEKKEEPAEEAEEAEEVVSKKDKKKGKKDKKGKKEEPAEKKAAKPKGPKGPGIIATIVECIEGAGKKKGITKAEILEVLEERFPDKEASSMKSTINVQVPNRITKEKFEVGKTKDGKGYYKVK